MTYARALRLIWIDMFITDGQFLLQRDHLRLAFDISTAQASLDLKSFQTLFPGRLIYNKSRKGYCAAPNSAPVFEPREHSAISLACSIAAQRAKQMDARP